MKSNFYTYDLESYPNIFTFCGKFRDSNDIQIFELSDRMNERNELLSFLQYLRNVGAEMVGFNNVGYDYVLIHELMTNPYTFDYAKAFQISQTIIKSQGFGGGFKYIKPKERYIPQVDLMKICHFDNNAKRTSLKALQFAMRSDSLEDLPFAIRALNNQEKDQLKKYNVHDVTETEKFLSKCEHLIDIRREYLNDGTLRGDVLNFSDIKIGTEYLVKRIGRHNCYTGNKPRITMREVVNYDSIILPKIHYRTETYQEVLSWFIQQRIYTVKGAKKPTLKTPLAGLNFVFGAGGVHAAADDKVFKTNETYQIIDVDVAGMYPSVSNANRFAPEHLGEAYVTAYRQVRDDRKRHAKGTSQNAILKLAGNGAFGNSNSVYSPFYDPKYTFTITINGQLQLLQLVEMVNLIPDCELIQGNTDGITVYINKKYEYLFKLWCDIWQEMTGLILEEVRYKRMWVKDVNNYISETMEGKLKLKGAYWYPTCEKDYEGVWNKDFSNLASKMAAVKVMTQSWSVQVALRLITDPFDFMLRYKCPKASALFIGEEKQLNTVRYYVSLTGGAMKKVSPPKGEMGQYKRANKLKDKYFNEIMSQIGKDVWDERIHTKNKGKYEIVTTSVQAGWLVKQCNVATDFDWSDLNWDYYIQEANKIVIGSK